MPENNDAYRPPIDVIDPETFRNRAAFYLGDRGGKGGIRCGGRALLAESLERSYPNPGNWYDPILHIFTDLELLDLHLHYEFFDDIVSRIQISDRPQIVLLFQRHFDVAGLDVFERRAARIPGPSTSVIDIDELADRIAGETMRALQRGQSSIEVTDWPDLARSQATKVLEQLLDIRATPKTSADNYGYMRTFFDIEAIGTRADIIRERRISEVLDQTLRKLEKSEEVRVSPVLLEQEFPELLTRITAAGYVIERSGPNRTMQGPIGYLIKAHPFGPSHIVEDVPKITQQGKNVVQKGQSPSGSSGPQSGQRPAPTDRRVKAILKCVSDKNGRQLRGLITSDEVLHAVIRLDLEEALVLVDQVLTCRDVLAPKYVGYLEQLRLNVENINTGDHKREAYGKELPDLMAPQIDDGLI